MSKILVITEQHGGSWNKMSLETLAAGQQIGGNVSAAVIGDGVDALAKELAGYALDKVYSVNHALLKDYTADAQTEAVAQLIKHVSPDLVIFPHTYEVRDFAPKLAARFGQVLISDVVGLRVEGGSPVFIRQLFQGKLNADVQATGPAPHFASMQAGAFRADSLKTGSAPVENFTPTLD